MLIWYHLHFIILKIRLTLFLMRMAPKCTAFIHLPSINKFLKQLCLLIQVVIQFFSGVFTVFGRIIIIYIIVAIIIFVSFNVFYFFWQELLHVLHCQDFITILNKVNIFIFHFKIANRSLFTSFPEAMYEQPKTYGSLPRGASGNLEKIYENQNDPWSKLNHKQE